MNARQEELRRRIKGLGFDDVRFARIDAVPAGPLHAWFAQGFQAEMAWMERTAAKRLNPDLVLPGVRSIIILGVNSWPGEGMDAGNAEKDQAAKSRPVWARYSGYEDYHDTIKPALVAAGRLIEELYGVSGDDYRYYADTGPVIERGWAERAGLGFLGKNGMLISRRFGNWLLLAAILTRTEFESDEPLRGDGQVAPAEGRTGLLCGKCTRCLDACPTQAFPRPGVVDARRCISYQTIENKGVIPRELRVGIGSRIFGCDVCLEVCPWNRFAQEGRRLLLVTQSGPRALEMEELLTLTPARFAEIFRRTPIKRLKLTGLLRNASVAAGNMAAHGGADHAWIAPLMRLATDHEVPLIRVHAVWAVHRIAGPMAHTLLEAARARETDPAVLAEHTAWQNALA